MYGVLDKGILDHHREAEDSSYSLNPCRSTGIIVFFRICGHRLRSRLDVRLGVLRACRHHRRRAQALATRLLCNLGASPDDGFLARLGPAKKGEQAAALYADKSRADDDPYRYYRW